MYSKILEDKLKALKIEDFIWFIYIGIIFLSFYSNNLERKYYINSDNKAKDEYRKIIILIFTILIFVYGYFLKSSFSDLKNIDKYEPEKQHLFIGAFIASLLIFIAGILFLIIAILDEDLDVELAFN